MTTKTTHTNNQHPVAPDHPNRIFAQWGLPHTVTPRFGARLIQEITICTFCQTGPH